MDHAQRLDSKAGVLRQTENGAYQVSLNGIWFDDSERFLHSFLLFVGSQDSGDGSRESGDGSLEWLQPESGDPGSTPIRVIREIRIIRTTRDA
ncbi:MAG: hypothetical protein Kow001_25760 [Acidobacteriota bacterium]